MREYVFITFRVKGEIYGEEKKRKQKRGEKTKKKK